MISVWLKQKIRELFGIDLRTLAVFRMGLAMLALTDLFFRAFDLTAHYTDAGIMPRDVLINNFLRPYEWSIFFISGSFWAQALLFLCFAFLLILMLLGYRTNYVVLLCWVFLHSLHVRNSYVLNGGDHLFRMLFLWATFVLLGKRYSIDARLHPGPPNQDPIHFSAGSIALLLQVVFMYFFTIALRSDSKSWHDGSALYYSLSQSIHSTPIGIWLLHFPKLLEKLTYATFYLESIGPLLLFCPFFTPWVRIVVVVLLSSLHTGIFFAMWVGMFPFFSIWGAVPFLPGFLWDKFKKLFWFVPVVVDWFLPHDKAPAPARVPVLPPRFLFLFKILQQGFVAFLLIAGSTTNLKSINLIPKNQLGASDHVARFFGIKQSWQMFQNPIDGVWRYVLQGRKFNGDLVNLSDPSR